MWGDCWGCLEADWWSTMTSGRSLNKSWSSAPLHRSGSVAWVQVVDCFTSWCGLRPYVACCGRLARARVAGCAASYVVWGLAACCEGFDSRSPDVLPYEVSFRMLYLAYSSVPNSAYRNLSGRCGTVFRNYRTRLRLLSRKLFGLFPPEDLRCYGIRNRSFMTIFEFSRTSFAESYLESSVLIHFHRPLRS